MIEDTVVISNDRDRRVLRWLLDKVGEAAIEKAASELAGARKPYLSNLCKQLGLTVPEDLALSDTKQAKAHLAAAKALLRPRFER